MASRNPQKPNVVVLLSDDQGPWALGCAGNDEILTPHLDNLASGGLRFSSFFCTSPVCSPARASLLTGKIPSQHGVHDWIKHDNTSEQDLEYLADHLAYTELLAKEGYTCGLSGKWHLGNSLRPQKGFSHWYVHRAGGGPYYGAPMMRNGSLVREPDYLTDLITSDALEFLDRHALDANPFYLGVHYTAPHSPWINNHPPEVVALYDDCPFNSCPQEPKHPWVHPRAFPGVWDNPREHLKGYFAAVTAMDEGIGRIMQRLEHLNLIDSTLVFFLSDNGFNCGHHGVWGKGNGTFPQNMYDTSVKVPAIACQPGRIPSGVVSDALISGYDFMPTLLDYLGIDHSAAQDLPGRSMAKLLRGEEDSGRDTVVVFSEYGPVRMIRSRMWKYVHRYPYGPHELYNMINDPSERVNLVDDRQHQSVAARMRTELAEWFLRYEDSCRTGVHEPVTGRGQLRLCGPPGRGETTFVADFARAPRSAAPGPGEADRVRVMTFNIHAGRGMDGILDLQRIADDIAYSAADIVGLNEVDRLTLRSNGVDQAAALADLLGMHLVFGPTIDYQGGQYGNAILSRFPIVSTQNILLPSGASEQRAMLHAELDCRGATVHLLVTHLSLIAEEQVKQLRRIKKLLNALPEPTILVGDFNMPAGTRRDPAPHLVPRVRDAWQEAVALRTPEELRHSPASFGNTYSSQKPIRRIDYVFISNELEVAGAAEVFTIDTHASDHRPVVAELCFSRR